MANPSRPGDRGNGPLPLHEQMYHNFLAKREEIFDVQILPGLRFPEVMGFQKEDIHNTFIIPPGSTVPPPG
jgi:hypothetical protein